MFCKNEQRVFYQTVDMFRLRLVLLIPTLNTNIDKNRAVSTACGIVDTAHVSLLI